MAGWTVGNGRRWNGEVESDSVAAAAILKGKTVSFGDGKDAVATEVSTIPRLVFVAETPNLLSHRYSTMNVHAASCHEVTFDAYRQSNGVQSPAA